MHDISSMTLMNRSETPPPSYGATDSRDTDQDHLIPNEDNIQETDEMSEKKRVKLSMGARISVGVEETGRDVRSFCSEVRDGVMSVDCKGYCSRTCTCQNFLDKFPILKWLPKYR